MTDAEDEMRLMIDAIELTEAEENNVQLLPNLELVRRFNATTQALLERSEALRPASQEGRDLHSQRAAYLVELKRRNLR